MEAARVRRLAAMLREVTEELLRCESAAATESESLVGKPPECQVRKVGDGYDLDFRIPVSWHPHTHETVRVTVRSLPRSTL